MFGALNNEVIGSHSQREWEELVMAWGWRCFYCGRPVQENPELIWDSLTRDHLVPLSRGGSDSIGNIVPACFNCNRLKGTMTVDEFSEARPVFFTDEHKLRRESYEVNALGRDQATKKHERFVHAAEILPPEPRVTEPTTGRELVAEWKVYTDKLYALRMNDGYPEDRGADWYQRRREQLRAQTQGLRRIQCEAAGQLQLPLNIPSSVKKAVATAGEAAELTVQKGMELA